jgi:hypothetical protein
MLVEKKNSSILPVGYKKKLLDSMLVEKKTFGFHVG